MSAPNLETPAECLDRVLASHVFAQADRLRELLRFLVNKSLAGEASALKESLIGIEVFGRDPGYDPKVDNIVRTSARRVRAKLEEYYESEGRDDAIRIEVPKGSYVAIFQPVEGRHSTTPTETFVPPPARPVRVIQTVSLLFALAAAIWLAATLARRKEPPSWHSRPFANSTGYQSYPAFSPDGKEVAFDWDGPNQGTRQIYVQGVNSQSPTQITTGVHDDRRPEWSPDGRQLAFTEVGPNANKIYIASANGENKRYLVSLRSNGPWLCNEPRISWSPQGDRLATVEQFSSNSTCAVALVDIRSGRKQWLTYPKVGELSDLEPAFSRDGKSVAFLRESSASIAEIYVVPSAGGNPRRVTFDEREVRGFSWAADGASFIVSSRRQGNFLNLWEMPLRRGVATPLTEGPLSLGFPSASPKGDRIAYMNYRDDVNIWRFDGSNQKWIASRGTDWSPQYSPDGRKIAYVSGRLGNLDIWICDSDGRNATRITDFVKYPAGSPVWSPDGRRLAFDVRVSGASHVYLSDLTSKKPPYRLTNGTLNEALPNWSRDGKFLYFVSSRNGAQNIYRVSISGGEPVEITQSGGLRGMESFDGRYLYFTKGQVGGIWRMELNQASTKEELILADLPVMRWDDWTLGAKGIYYLSFGPSKAELGSLLLMELPSRNIRQLGQTQGAAQNGGLSVLPGGNAVLYSQLDEWGSDILFLEH
jgi:Tol biopolymer transport system component